MVLSTYIGIKATHKNERARDIAQKFYELLPNFQHGVRYNL